MAAAVALAGCASTPQEPASAPAPLSGELAASSRVDQVVLASGANETFSAAFTGAAKRALAACATGAKPLRLEVTIARRTGATARFVDPATGAAVAAYSVAAPGADAAAAGRALGEDLCDRAFPAGPRVG